MGKKRKIRKMRSFGRKNADGTTSTHKMAHGTSDGKHIVFPTIKPKDGNKGSSNPKDWEKQSYEKARAAGEVISFNSKKRAKKIAEGSWKKKKDR